MTDLRIRQLVIAANDLSTADALRAVLDLGAPYPDPGVGEFGLINAVFAIGDQFLEVIVPTRDDAPARRFINRQGEGGYMIIFHVPDIEWLPWIKDGKTNPDMKWAPLSNDSKAPGGGGRYLSAA